MAAVAWVFTLVVAIALLGTTLISACGGDDDRRAMDDYVAFVEPRLDGELAVWDKIRKWSVRRQEERVDPPEYYDFLEREAVPFYEQLVKDLVSHDPALEKLRPAHRELVQFAQYRLEFVRTEQRLGDTFRAGGQLLSDLSEAEMEAQQTRRDYHKDSEGLDRAFDGRYTQIAVMWDDFHAVYLVRCLEGDITIAELRQRIQEHVLVKLGKMRHSRFADNDHARKLRRVVVTTIAYFEALDAAADVFIPSKRAAVYSDEQIKAGEKALRGFKTELRDARAK